MTFKYIYLSASGGGSDPPVGGRRRGCWEWERGMDLPGAGREKFISVPQISILLKEDTLVAKSGTRQR